MCGIAAVAGFGSSAELLVRKMICEIEHRGPDAKETWHDDLVCLGHARLRIIDLLTGAQPMHRDDLHASIVLNGEVYNYLELREELSSIGHHFETNSDTEVLLVAYRAWGEQCVLRLRGMFAFVIYDRLDQSLFAARDRFGKKPLLYWAERTRIAFASEAKSLLQIPDVGRDVDPSAISSYFHQLYVPEHRCVFQKLRKLAPGHTLRWRAGVVSTSRYWSPRFTVDPTLRFEDAIDQLDTVLQEAVRIRLRADVPIGVFLSGGIDSSLVATTAAQVSGSNLKTYTVRIEGLPDEAANAGIVAESIGSDHTLIDVPEPDVERILKVLESFDEPFADSSAVPMSLISQVAKEHVTVVLSGDGGDELFAGYGSYIEYSGALHDGRSQGIARSSRALRALRARLPRTFEHFLRAAIPDVNKLPIRRSAPTAANILERHVSALRVHYEPSISKLVVPSVGNAADTAAAEQRAMVCDSEDALNRVFEYDVRHYLAGDILKKVDIATMSWALEARAPLLDSEVAALSMRMSPRQKVAGGVTKRPLKALLLRRLGSRAENLINRGKTGFGAPVAFWLQKPDMANAVHDILVGSSLRSEEWVNPEGVRKLVSRFYSGRTYLAQPLWNLLALEVWARKFAGPR